MSRTGAFGCFAAVAAAAGTIAVQLALDAIPGSGPLPFAVGGLVIAGSVHFGIASRRRYERALAAARESEQRFATVFDVSPVPLALVRMPKGTVIEGNESLLRLFEYDRDEIVGRTTVELGVTPSPAFAAMAWELGRGGSVRDLECVRRTADGIHTLAISADLVSIAGDGHAMLAIRDITDQRRLEARIRESEQQVPASELVER